MKKTITLIISLCLILARQMAAAQTPTNLNGWIPDGQVRILADDANHVYLGGDFNYMVKEGVAGSFNCGVVVETSGIGQTIPGGSPLVKGGGSSTSVEVAIPDGNGGWYIGGNFTQVAGVTRNRIAHINPDGTLDMTWNPNANNGIRVLVLSGSDLYVGGGLVA
jgi:hypothetical protein